MQSILTDHIKYIADYEKPVYWLHDVTVPATYFFAKIESQLFLVLACDYKTSLEDVQVVKYLEFMVGRLRNWTVFDVAK
jgi:hypothetical protein